MGQNLEGIADGAGSGVNVQNVCRPINDLSSHYFPGGFYTYSFYTLLRFATNQFL